VSYGLLLDKKELLFLTVVLSGKTLTDKKNAGENYVKNLSKAGVQKRGAFLGEHQDFFQSPFAPKYRGNI